MINAFYFYLTADMMNYMLNRREKHNKLNNVTFQAEEFGAQIK